MVYARLLAPLALLFVLPALASGDPLTEQQWHLEHVGAVRAWERSTGDGVVVAVVDSGVEATHPDLTGQVISGRDFVDPGTEPDDANGHGTVVAGVIAAIAGNGEGGAGVAPNARIMPVRVLDAEGRGRSRDVAAGIRWAVEHGAAVVNLSLTEEPGSPAQVLITSEVEQAIHEAHDAGVVVVGAAGNDGQETRPYSDDLPILVVGATDRDDQLWERTNHDAGTLFAPGTGIVSTYRGGGYASADGTSFAAPVVAAAAAMLLEGGLQPTEVVGQLAGTAVDIGAGLGRVDVARAVGAPAENAGSPPPEPEPAPTREQEPATVEPAPPPSPTVRPEPEPTPTPGPTPEPSPRPPPGITPLPAADGGDRQPLLLAPPAPPDRERQPGLPEALAFALLAATVAAHIAARFARRANGADR